jgi:glycosyltransferase involved in cell wall biosynthesis
MRIAQVAPLFESCPPQLYGGTERVVSYLTEDLVRLGHDVTLFASGDSVTTAELVSPVPRALRLTPGIRDPLTYHTILLDLVAERAREFDVLHFHLDYLHFALAASLGVPTLTTQHGRLDLADLGPVFERFSYLPQISISDHQRTSLPTAGWTATVYHGVPSYRVGTGAGGYLAFLGRFSPEKRPDRAIEIARGSGVPLKLAAKVDPVDRAYFEREIEPMLSDTHAQWIGEIGEDRKPAFLGDALALVFPIDWPEPFGLVMIEALACGTPVIAFRGGSVEEIVEPGVTGFIVDSVEEAIEAVGKLRELDRATVRRRFEARFSIQRMTEDYLTLYQRLASRTPELDAA